VSSSLLPVFTTGKPVSFEEDKFSPDVKTIESIYRILEP
jgi:hypothetical protein